MAKLIMGIGLAGSGKTTTLVAFAERHGYKYVGIDDFRKKHAIGNGEASTRKAWDEMRSSVREHLERGETVVVESTFVNGPDRRKFLRFARECGATKIQGVFLNTPAELAWEQSVTRGRVVPEYIHKERTEMLAEHPPTIEDGFDALFTLDEFQKLTEAETLTGRKEFGREKPRFS